MTMQVFLVGGAVRDTLLGRQPKDQDWVIVGASQEDIDRLVAEGYTQVGSDFPVFLHPETGDEYALARVERKTGAGYHGFTVKADSNVTVEEDLARRDLTINSMAMSDGGDVIDPYGGLRDLHNRILRHTTEAFAEDPLRVLRLARFAARFSGWKVAPETIELCKQIGEAGELNHLSIERVWTEMEKAFKEPSPHRFLEILDECDALKHCKILADLFEYNDTDKRLMSKLSTIPENQRLFVAIGAIAVKVPCAHGGPMRARDCFENMNEVLGADRNAVDLYRVLKKSRALQSGIQFSDLIEAVFLYERAGVSDMLSFGTKDLIKAQHIAMNVRAIEFAGLEGKALGKAIEDARISALRTGLDIK